MKNIYMMAKANLKKMKIQGVSLVVLLMISSLMLSVGLMMMINFQGFLGDIAAELDTSDAFYTLPYAQLTDDIRNRIEGNEQILSLDVYDGVVVHTGISGWTNRDESQIFIVFRNKETEQAVSRWKLVSDTLSDAPNPVFVPYGFSSSGGFSLGDRIEMTVNNIPLSFTIAGFIEDIYFSNAGSMLFAFYVPDSTYAELVQTFEQHHAAILFADLDGNPRDVELFMGGIFEEGIAAGIDSSLQFLTMTHEMMVNGRIILPGIMSIMIIIFALIIVIVCLTMIRFRINNSIEEEMPAIGSQKAAGYTSWQIRASLWVQYLLVALFGAFIGVPLTYLVLPFIRRIIAMQTGLAWQQGLDLPLNVIAVIVVVLMVTVLTLICSRKIKNIDPVVAIRGGVTAYSFKRNHVPLNETKLPLNLALGSKTMLQNLKQSISLFVVFTLIAFTAVFFVNMRHMATVQRDNYIALMGAELSDVVFDLRPGTDSHYVQNVVATMNGVTQAIFIDSTRITINGESTVVYVMDDFSAKVNPSVYQGRYPIHPNEIALSGFAADAFGVGVDDILHIGEQNVPFIVTGLTQGSGTTEDFTADFVNISITTAGLSEIQPEFSQLRLAAYLEDRVDVNGFIAEVSASFGGEILSAINWRNMAMEENGVVADILVLLSSVMLGFAIAVILLVLYFIVGAVIVRRHRLLGIQKAMGYTTFELMRQVSVSFIIPLITGLTAGAVLMAFTYNNIAASIMTPLGVRQVNFDIPYLWVTLTGIALAIISYATIMMITGRIRKISAYDLVR